MTNFIGPALPPHLLQKASTDEDANMNSGRLNKLRRSKENEDIGPALPPHILQIASEDAISNDWENGPPLLSKKKITQSEMSEDSSDDVIGPVPVPHNKVTNVLGDSCSYIGPSLPPKLKRNVLDAKKKNKGDENKSCSSGSSVDDTCIIGPVIPKSLQGSEEEDDVQESSVNVSVIGPKIPPFLMSKRNRKSVAVSKGGSKDKEIKLSIIGPSLPPNLAERVDEMPTIVDDVTLNTNSKSSIDLYPLSEKNPDNEVDSDMYGPALPPGFSVRTSVAETTSKPGDSDSDDGAVMGPLPEGVPSSSKVQHQLEIRARHLRETMACQEKETSKSSVRESWMLELPDDRAPELGLKPRQFRMREVPKGGDRSVWTDTPADREKKKQTPKSVSPDRGALERLARQKRDEAMEEVAEQHGKKRGSRSLVEIHEEKLSEKRKKEAAAGERPERRPFSREIDLQVNRFDEAQKRSIMKKAHQLNDRFSSGQSKFL